MSEPQTAAGFAGDATIDKLHKRFADYEATQGPQPGSAAHLQQICGDCGDEHARVIELPSATLLIIVDLDPVGLESLTAEIERHRAAGVRIVVTATPGEAIGRMLDEARAESAQQERALTWRQRLARWWSR